MIESTAAALGYGLLSAGTKSILVVDIGGGTTDVTIINVKDNHIKTLSSKKLQEINEQIEKKNGIEVNVMATSGHSQVIVFYFSFFWFM